MVCVYIYICAHAYIAAIMHCSPNETIFRSNVMCVGKYDRRYGPVRLMFSYCTWTPSLNPTVINNWNSAAAVIVVVVVVVVVVPRIWKTYPKPCGLHRDAAPFCNTIWFLLLLILFFSFFFQKSQQCPFGAYTYIIIRRYIPTDYVERRRPNACAVREECA